MVPRTAATLAVELTDRGTRRTSPRPAPSRRSAADVLLAVWGRRPLLPLHTDGDPTILRNWPTI